jgi:hypothetical protein
MPITHYFVLLVRSHCRIVELGMHGRIVGLLASAETHFSHIYAAVRDVADAALEAGVRDRLQSILEEDAWASWLRLLNGAWAADPRIQNGYVRDCIEEAHSAVQNTVANGVVSGEDAQPLLDMLDHWKLANAAAPPEVCIYYACPCEISFASLLVILD